jgi:hypothetical protein
MGHLKYSQSKYSQWKRNIDVLLFIVLLGIGGFTVFMLNGMPVRPVSAYDSIYLPVVSSDTTPTPIPSPTPTIVPTPGPVHFRYMLASMRSRPNIGNMYLDGIVLDRFGRAVNGVTVELQFWDNRIYRTSGLDDFGRQTLPPGYWGFTPLAHDQLYHPVPFNVRLVKSKAEPVPLSDTLLIYYTGNVFLASQFTDIAFQDVGLDARSYYAPTVLQPGAEYEANLAANSRYLPAPPPEPTTIPEPVTFALFGAGLAGLGAWLRQSKKRNS